MSTIKLNSGYEVPIFGLGTWLSKPGEVKLAVENALNLGYKLIDCAWAYCNEPEIGEVLERYIKCGKVKREELFVTSKLWNSFHRPELVKVGFEETLRNLKLNYLDLFLIHTPISYKPGNLFPDADKFKDEIEDVDLVETWKAMEKLVDSGKVRSIGVSNFNIRQVQNILDHCRIKPAMNQIEVNVYFPNKKLVEFCLKNGVQITAYSPLGGAPDRPIEGEKVKRPLEDPKVLELAQKYNASAGQILIKYTIHRGLVTIPKSVSALRLEENIKALNIKLTDEDFQKLDSLNVNIRMCSPELFKMHKNYPFGED